MKVFRTGTAVAYLLFSTAGFGQLRSKGLGHTATPVPVDCLTTQPRNTSPIQFPVSYVLSYDVAFTKQPSDAIRSEADRFISIGLQKIADGYSISATGWDIRRSPCGKNGLQVEILSPYSSTSLSSDSVSANIASLLRLDKSFDDTSPFRSTAYRWRFSSTAFIFPGTADPKSLNVTANIRVELEGHNAYASSSFQPINVASTQALQLFDDQLSQALFAAYVTTMKAQGVTISLPKDTQSDLPAIK